MNWIKVLKNLNPATQLARTTQLNDTKATGKSEVMRNMKHNVDRIGNDYPTLEHLKTDMKLFYQNIYMDDTEQWFNQATWMQSALNNAGYTYDDVDWDEALIPVLNLYDEIIDNITMEDLL